MLTLGFDPGVATIGFGFVDSNGGKMIPMRYGAIRTSAGLSLSTRLASIYQDAVELIDTFKPDAVAVEELFSNVNVKTCIAVAHARGVLLLAGQKCGVPLCEYTPLQVKQAVTGYGRADKKQVMEMVKRLLNLEKIPRPDDAADALAIAICHARTATSLLIGQEFNICSTI